MSETDETNHRGGQVFHLRPERCRRTAVIGLKLFLWALLYLVLIAVVISPFPWSLL